eukprot:2459640-Prymnesium_polylepis.2
MHVRVGWLMAVAQLRLRHGQRSSDICTPHIGYGDCAAVCVNVVADALLTTRADTSKHVRVGWLLRSYD